MKWAIMDGIKLLSSKGYGHAARACSGRSGRLERRRPDSSNSTGQLLSIRSSRGQFATRRLCKVIRIRRHLHQYLPASSGQWLRRHDLLNFITALYEGDLPPNGAVVGQRHPWRADERFAGNPCSGARLGPGHGYVDQAWCEAGGSAPEQSRRTTLDLFRILDAVHRRRPHGGGRCAGSSFAADRQDTIVPLAMGRDAPAVEWTSTLKGNQRRYKAATKGCLCRVAGGGAGRGESHRCGGSGLCGLTSSCIPSFCKSIKSRRKPLDTPVVP